ncbi:hypothetical protein [Photobacterium iliopiscarium]|uniref:hypothetical protein n=1 Tax=Photobacterium iliopiscarium TaxID=56192 RepID=UPI0005D2F90C|nr:hypothetical protein [Photobacterium iliopiscarium]KJG13813.1 hypothetical protein UB38_07080 [Photobacterium iliopiscarium]PSU00874.1 hypothetical protein C9I85_05185 [Photobacterium iliopiscarium]PSV82081.1 hypothetical protein C9J51_12755 [Photobacterium iliopiscarium]
MEKELARYKTSESFPLEMYFPMEFLQDLRFCNALGDDILLCGDGWEKIAAVSAASSGTIPDTKGIYMFIWKPEFSIEHDKEIINFRYVVYIGSAAKGSSSILKRFNSDYKKLINQNFSVHWTEARPSNRESRLKKILNLGALEYWYITMVDASSEQILDIEKRLICLFNPPGNQAFKSPIRATIDRKKVAPAFE